MAEDKPVHTVHLEPVGIDMEVEEGETVLDAAFRQGIALMHGCKEGQCASCKSVLLEGDADLLKYSTFALSDFEREQDYVLLCRTQAYGDLVVELLNYDEDILSHAIPVKEYGATVQAVETLTHDMRKLVIELDGDQSLPFWAGQYVDITLPERNITRSFSMANPPSEGAKLEFIIKIYPDGAFSSLLDGEVNSQDKVALKGPYGTCFRRAGDAPMYFVGGGSGMAPLLSMLADLVESGEQHRVVFFYGARTQRDLFYIEEINALGQELDEFEFIPVLSHEDEGSDWSGERGMVHEAVSRFFNEEEPEEDAQVYACGPPPMIDALTPILHINDVDPDNIHYDKFTQAAH